MIDDDTVSLPVCAFGAGLGHVLALALILPVVITLPAPGADRANGAVAIQVAVRTEPLMAPEAEGDAEDTLAPSRALASQEITAALPEPAGIPEELPEPDADEGETGLQAETAPTAVANIDPAEPAVAVPLPARKPKVTNAVEAPEAKAAKPAPKPRVSTRASPRTRPSPVKKGFLGGSPATGGYQYPVPGRMPGSG